MSKLVQEPPPDRKNKFDKNGWATLNSDENNRKKFYRLYVKLHAFVFENICCCVAKQQISDNFVENMKRFKL